jgi:hypothetical protein
MTHAEHQARYRKRHPERVKAIDKAYRERHREQVAAREKAYKERHREQIAAYKKAYKASARGKDVDRRYEERHRDKHLARRAIDNAVQNGRIIKPDRCSECGAKCLPHGHHDDYTKPLDVRWLCARCHVEVHRQRGVGSAALTGEHR